MDGGAQRGRERGKVGAFCLSIPDNPEISYSISADHLCVTDRKMKSVCVCVHARCSYYNEQEGEFPERELLASKRAGVKR